MTKQEQKNAAWEAYRAIERPAYEVYKAIYEPVLKAYRAEIMRIENEPEEDIIEPEEDIIEVDGKRYQLIK